MPDYPAELRRWRSQQPLLRSAYCPASDFYRVYPDLDRTCRARVKAALEWFLGVCPHLDPHSDDLADRLLLDDLLGWLNDTYLLNLGSGSIRRPDEPPYSSVISVTSVFSLAYLFEVTTRPPGAPGPLREVPDSQDTESSLCA